MILNQAAEKVFTSYQLGIKSKYLKDTLNSDQWLLDLSFGNITLQLLAFSLPLHTAPSKSPSSSSCSCYKLLFTGSFATFLAFAWTKQTCSLTVMVSITRMFLNSIYSVYKEDFPYYWSSPTKLEPTFHLWIEIVYSPTLHSAQHNQTQFALDVVDDILVKTAPKQIQATIMNYL